MTATDATRKTKSQDPGWHSIRTAHVGAVSFWLLSLVLFRQQLSELVNLSLHDERSSHIVLIPFISAVFLYLQRRRVFRTPLFSPALGLPLLLLAVVLWFGLKAPLSSLAATNRLSGITCLIVLSWIGIFALCYGISALKAAAFPLLFLILMVPLPVAVAEYTVSVLQKGSADTCDVLFRLLGIPFIRHGFQFSLPGVDIEVAEQCSGIHSALSLFITGLLAGHVFLQSGWRKLFFVLCLFPIAIFKNAVRIVAISWLGIHVNPGFFHGALHHQGGLPFSFIALLLMAVLLWLLRRGVPFPRRVAYPKEQVTGVV